MGTAQTYWGTSIFHQSTGVTYHFATEVEYGYYWNGDPFVVSGGANVVITKITPEDAPGGRVTHGAMLQPDDNLGNGFDSAAAWYISGNNVDPAATGKNLIIDAATYPGGASLVKAVSLVDLSLTRTQSEIDKFSVLTVVPSTPPEHAFRPPIAGTDKTSHYTLDDLDFSKLQSVALVPGQKPLSDFHFLKEATFVSWWSGQQNLRDFHPTSYHVGYGDYQFDDIILPALLALHSNYTTEEKRDLYAAIVQNGIDLAGGAANGADWSNPGGHSNGLKPVVVFAASALDSAELKEVLATSSAFSEDDQFRYITAQDVGSELFDWGANKVPKIGAVYQDAHVGTPEWIIEEGSRRDPELDAAYRWIMSDNAPITGLVMEMLGNGEGREIWNNEAYFDYAERIRLIHIVNPRVDSAHSANREWMRFLEAYHSTFSDGASIQFRPETPQQLTVSMNGRDLDVVIGGDVFSGSSPVTRVDVRYRTAQEDWNVIQDFGMIGTISGLTGSSVYFVQARYVNDAGEGPWTSNRFEILNQDMVDRLKAEGLVTQAEIDAVGGLARYLNTENYRSHLRNILNGDERYKDLADQVLSGTAILPSTGTLEEEPEAEIDPDPIVYPVVPDLGPADPVLEPAEPSETEPGLGDGEVSLEDVIESGTTPIPVPEDFEDSFESEVIDETPQDEPTPVEVVELPGSTVDSPQVDEPVPSGGKPGRGNDHFPGKGRDKDILVWGKGKGPYTIEGLPATLQSEMENAEEVEDDAPTEGSSDGGDFAWVLAAALVVPLLLAFAR